MLWCVDRSSIEGRMRGAAERTSSVKLPLLTRNEALEKSLVEALGFEVDGIERRRGLSYVKVRRMYFVYVLCDRLSTCSQQAGMPRVCRRYFVGLKAQVCLTLPVVVFSERSSEFQWRRYPNLLTRRCAKDFDMSFAQLPQRTHAVHEHAPQVKKVVPGSVAHSHGIQVGDIFEAVSGRPVIFETRTT